MVEGSFASVARYRCLARDDERLPETVAGLHFLTFACPMLHRLVTAAAQTPYRALGGRKVRGGARPQQDGQRRPAGGG